MQFFFTEYSPIAYSNYVSSSSLIVTGVEGVPYDPESYMQISLRTPKNKEYYRRPGVLAERISEYFKQEYNASPIDVEGGGHKEAAAIRIKQRLVKSFLQAIKISEREKDLFDAVNEMIDRGLKKA